jgi:diguanylate cyclase (GGDEF)-like protein
VKNDELLCILGDLGKDIFRLIFEDDLTGIYNRRFLFNYLETRIPWDGLRDRAVSLIMIDIDRFKEINDLYGHLVGDHILIRVADLIREVCGKDQSPIRYAGDEFMILMDRGSKAEAWKVVSALLRRVQDNPLRLNGNDENGFFRIALSVGVASAPEDAQTGKGLIQKADAALYEAKSRERSLGHLPVKGGLSLSSGGERPPVR